MDAAETQETDNERMNERKNECFGSGGWQWRNVNTAAATLINVKENNSS